MDGCAATAGMGCIGRLPIRDQKLLRVGQKGLGWMGPLPICPLQASSNFFSREDAWKLVCCILLKLFGVFIFTVLNQIGFQCSLRSFTWLKLSQDYAHGVSEDCLWGGVSWLALVNQVKSVKHPCGPRCSDVQLSSRILAVAEHWGEVVCTFCV